MKFSKTFLIFTSFMIGFSLLLGSFDDALAVTTVKKPSTAKVSAKSTVKKSTTKKPVAKKKTVAKKKSSVNLNPPRITLETAPHSEKKVSKKKKATKKPIVKKKT